MIETIRRLILAGLGTLDLTEEKLRAVFDDLVRRGEITEKEARETVTDWMRRANEQRARLQQQIDDSIKRFTEKRDAPLREAIEALTARVEALERRLEPPSQPPVPPM